MVEKVSRECLPEMNQAKAENASLIVTTFVHNHAGFQKDGTPDNELGNGWGCYDLGLQNENLILKAKELGQASRDPFHSGNRNGNGSDRHRKSSRRACKTET